MIDESTKNGLSENIFTEIKERHFSIIGCGGTGAFFAEMLIRTGAINLTIIDGDTIEPKNLNRTPFVASDIGNFKVNALKCRLNNINKNANIHSIKTHIGFQNLKDKTMINLRQTVGLSNVAIIAVDKKKIRKECETLCKEHHVDYLVIGIGIDNNTRYDSWACGWNSETPEEEIEEEGYGINNGSYMSLCMEAVSAGFNLMMHCMGANIKTSYIISKKYQDYKEISIKDD